LILRLYCIIRYIIYIFIICNIYNTAAYELSTARGSPHCARAVPGMNNIFCLAHGALGATY